MFDMAIKIFKLLFLNFVENLKVLWTIIKISYFGTQGDSDSKEGCAVVVFSKDRPLQLEALINSFFFFAMTQVRQ